MIRFTVAFLGFVFCLLFSRAWILLSRKRSLFQKIRDEGPKDHLEKKGSVPTMGGIAIMAAVLVSALAVWSMALLIPLTVFFACGLLGLADDALKLYRGKNLGLKARHKLAGQIVIGAGLWFAFRASGAGSDLSVPFLGTWNAGIWFLPLVVFVLVSTTNAVNLTDGLDGLACGTAALVAAFFMLASPAASASSLISAAILGACAGFLWHNGFPARVFMGDSGSLALGGALCVLGFQTRLVLWLPIAGGIFVAETLSVMMQVVYFKLTGGKRIFKMSPLHHHFELSGVPETQVTIRFWIVTFFLSWLSVIGAARGF